MCIYWKFLPSSLLPKTMTLFDENSYCVGKMQLRTLQGWFRNNLTLVLCSRPTMDALRLANSAFAVDLFKQLCEKEPAGNVLFSPICLSTSLSLVQVGAKGDTANEIGQVSPMPCFCFEWKQSYKNTQVVPGEKGMRLRNKSFAISSTLLIYF